MILSGLAGWNQTEADWNLLLHLHPEGCLAMECDGDVVASTTLMCYGDDVAWLGMVLTHPSYRRRGFARRLVESALRIAEAKNIKSVKLDATERGLPLYESLGFRKEQLVERRSRLGPLVVRPDSPTRTGRPKLEIDRQAFGAGRAQLLERLAERASPFVTDDGFGMTRPGAHASYLGPCVARSPESARLLIPSCLSTDHGDWLWDLLPLNRSAVKLAEDLGFTVSRTQVRMVKGPYIRGNESMIYALGGLELG